MTTPTPETPSQQPAAQQQGSDEMRALVTELTKPELSYDAATFRKAIVTAVSLTATPPTASVQISGDTTTTVAGVRFVDAYLPVVGHTVLLVKQGSDIWILGKIADGTGTQGWTQATLGSGWAHDGNSMGDVEYRKVLDNGSWKMQWRGAATTSNPTVLASPLAAGLRPAKNRKVVAARGFGGGAVGVHLVFHSTGNVTIDGYTYALTSSASGDAHVHSHNGAVPQTSFAETHTHAVTVTEPDWVSFHGVEYFL